MSDLQRRYSFQSFTDGKDDAHEMFKMEEDSVDIIGFERSGLIYYVILLEGFSGHKAWVTLKMDDNIRGILDGLVDCSLGVIEVLAEECPLLSQSILNGCIEKRYNNGAFVKVGQDWFFQRDLWITWENGIWVYSSWEICCNLVERLTQMIDEFTNFKGFNWKQNAKIVAKDISYGYKKLRPYITIGKIILAH